ncbi:unnamed protein product, partial [Meganyctiphanes norvegica]
MSAFMEPLKKKPKCRVELHVHLDGAVRVETIWELMKQKDIKLPGSGSLSDLKDAVTVRQPTNLAGFLSSFGIFIDALVGDLVVMERIAYEFVEDQAKQSVAYCEARFCPHLLVPQKVEEVENDVTAESILQAVLRGFTRGEEEFGTKVRAILCCIRGKDEWSWDLLRLCEEYKDQGVVGIDVAGDEATCVNEFKDKQTAVQKVFTVARHTGLEGVQNSTKCSKAILVRSALDELHVERIGHGYRVIEDEDLFKRCIESGIHFEVCPMSSYLTGAIASLQTLTNRHPVLRFSEEGASFSINTDDPLVTGLKLDDEYMFLKRYGFNEANFTRSNFQAALHSFLPPEEKKELLEQLHLAYGFINPTSVIPPEVQLEENPERLATTSPKPSISFGTWEERS